MNVFALDTAPFSSGTLTIFEDCPAVNVRVPDVEVKSVSEIAAPDAVAYGIVAVRPEATGDDNDTVNLIV